MVFEQPAVLLRLRVVQVEENAAPGVGAAVGQQGLQGHVSKERIAILRAYGAEVVVCPVAVEPDDPQSYYSVAARLTDELGAFRPNQYQNPHNPEAHVKTTGPEIWRQTAGRITHFVAGAGTCGSITGVARYLKEQNPAVRIIAADPEIIFFDEPTTGLDPIMAGVINELIREIVSEMGATAMTITPDMS